MTLATLATCYALSGLMADGTMTPSFAHSNPRVLAASHADLDAGRVRLGDKVCVRFQGGDRYTYAVRDRCAACDAGTVDLLVRSPEQAGEFGRQPVTVTNGACTSVSVH